MANNYTEFSEEIIDIPDEALPWLQEILAIDLEEEGALDKLEELLDEDPSDCSEAVWPGCAYELQGNTLWLYADGGNADYVAVEYLVRALFRKYMPTATFTLTYAEHCGNPRIGEFGGGWLIISKDETRGSNAHAEMRGFVKEMQQLAESTELRETLGVRFSSEDLDSHVRELKAQEAADINNSCVEEQLRYMLLKGGKDWLETLLDMEGD